ncbi:MAG: 30S ribosomal protein S16 [Candidatus Limivicinus sp.]|jgi:small subunit ribosomal protein S16
MVKIRLRRVGAKKAPYYRIIVADSHFARDGRFIEELGVYDPSNKEKKLQVNMERAQYWISKGAQPTDTVRGLLKKVEA